MRKLFNDEAGLVVSAELVLVLTVGVLSMIVGLSAVRDAINNELGDIADAFGAVSQTYATKGTSKASNTGAHARITGFGYEDRADDCDCTEVALVDVCGKTDSSGLATAE